MSTPYLQATDVEATAGLLPSSLSDSSGPNSEKDRQDAPHTTLYVWMILATACCVPWVLFGAAGVLMSPMAMDAPGSSMSALLLPLLLSIGIPTFFICCVVSMWKSYQEQNYKMAFWKGVPLVVAVLAPLAMMLS